MVYCLMALVTYQQHWLLYCLDGRYRKVERHLIPFYFDELIRVDGDLGMR